MAVTFNVHIDSICSDGHHYKLRLDYSKDAGTPGLTNTTFLDVSRDDFTGRVDIPNMNLTEAVVLILRNFVAEGNFGGPAQIKNAVESHTFII